MYMLAKLNSIFQKISLWKSGLQKCISVLSVTVIFCSPFGPTGCLFLSFFSFRFFLFFSSTSLTCFLKLSLQVEIFKCSTLTCILFCTILFLTCLLIITPTELGGYRKFFPFYHGKIYVAFPYGLIHYLLYLRTFPFCIPSYRLIDVLGRGT